jgi:hypothetical protein
MPVPLRFEPHPGIAVPLSRLTNDIGIESLICCAAASSHLAPAGRRVATRRHIVRTDRTGFKHGQPIPFARQPPKYERVFLGVEARVEIVSGRGGRKDDWNMVRRRLASRVTIQSGFIPPLVTGLNPGVAFGAARRLFERGKLLATPQFRLENFHDEARTMLLA